MKDEKQLKIVKVNDNKDENVVGRIQKYYK